MKLIFDGEIKKNKFKIMLIKQCLKTTANIYKNDSTTKLLRLNESYYNEFLL